MKKGPLDGTQDSTGKMTGEVDSVDAANDGAIPVIAAARQSTVAKVSHTLSIALAERLEEFAFFQRVSESAVIEHSLTAFFAQTTDDAKLGHQLRSGGAGRRRKK